MSLDPEHKFDLALELGKLDDARKILDDMPKEEYDTTDAQSKWKRLGDLALTKYVLPLTAVPSLLSTVVLLLPLTVSPVDVDTADEEGKWKRLGDLDLALTE